MDEPLSNLDAKLRVQMRAEIKELHKRLGVTFIYVTHDQAEAMTLSDRVAVMLDGELLQVATPKDIYANPSDRRVAEFVGSPKINILEGVVCARGLVNAGGSVFAIETGCKVGTPLFLGVRPESLHISESPETGELVGEIRLIEHLGADTFVHLDVQGIGDPVIARLSPERASSLSIGEPLRVSARSGDILVFSADGHRVRPTATVAALARARS